MFSNHKKALFYDIKNPLPDWYMSSKGVYKREVVFRNILVTHILFSFEYFKNGVIQYLCSNVVGNFKCIPDTIHNVRYLFCITKKVDFIYIILVLVVKSIFTSVSNAEYYAVC